MPRVLQGRGRLEELLDLIHYFFDGSVAVVEEGEIALRDVLRVYASTDLIDIGRRSIAVVVAGDGSGDTDVFRCIDDNDAVAEEVKAGLKENGGLEE